MRALRCGTARHGTASHRIRCERTLSTKIEIKLITQATSIGKSNVRSGVRLSVCPVFYNRNRARGAYTTANRMQRVKKRRHTRFQTVAKIWRFNDFHDGHLGFLTV